MTALESKLQNLETQAAEMSLRVAATLIYLPITSDLERVPDVRVPILPSKENGLRLPSEVMIDIVQTVPREKFGPVIGQIDPVTMTLVEAALSLRLGLLD